MKQVMVIVISGFSAWIVRAASKRCAAGSARQTCWRSGLPEGACAFAAHILTGQAEIAQQMVVDLREVEPLQMAVVPAGEQPPLQPGDERKRPAAGEWGGSGWHRRSP